MPFHYEGGRCFTKDEGERFARGEYRQGERSRALEHEDSCEKCSDLLDVQAELAEDEIAASITNSDDIE